MAGTVPVPALLGMTAVTMLLLAGAAQLDDDHVRGLGYALEVALLAALFVGAGWFARRAVRRFGGVTADLFGAVVEVSFAVFLMCTSLQPWWFHHLPGAG